MKCGNENCDYDLYLDELDFVICPKCGELIRQNLQPEHFKKLFLTGQTERFRNETRWFERVERWLRLSPFFLCAISQMFVFGVGGDVLAEGPVDSSDIWARQLVMEVQMVFAISALCFVINKAYDYLRVVFTGERWHRHLWPHVVIKVVVYAIIIAVLATNQIPEFYAFLDQAPKTRFFTEPVIQSGLTNARFWFTGLIWWNLAVNFIADMVDAYNEQRVFLMNKIILTNPIE